LVHLNKQSKISCKEKIIIDYFRLQPQIIKLSRQQRTLKINEIDIEFIFYGCTE